MNFNFEEYLAIERTIAYTVRELTEEWKILSPAPELLTMLLRLSKLSAKEFTVLDREIVLFQNHSYKTVSRGRIALRELIMVNPSIISMQRKMHNKPYTYKFNSKLMQLIRNRVKIHLKNPMKGMSIVPKRYLYKKKETK